MTARVLFVDDEPAILAGFRRTLGRRYAVSTAVGGTEGLELLAEEPGFAVVVSDMKMPGMDGITFLKRVREQAPDAVRVMLTGLSDQKTATDAVNEGAIFRFLNKPCAPAEMDAVLAACVRQHQLVTAEKELLESTLKGSVQVLVDILSLANPVAFSRAMRLKHYAVHAARALSFTEPWRLEVAAMLSQIGFVTVPGDVIEKIATGESLVPSEQRMVDDLPGTASHLIGRIPRLEGVARMIAAPSGQDPSGDGRGAEDPEITLGGAVLRAASDLDALVLGGREPAEALEAMASLEGRYDPRVLRVLGDVEAPTLRMAVRPMKVRDLRAGMALAEDVRTHGGLLVVGKGQEVTEALRRRLANFCALGNIGEPLRVYVPCEVELAGVRETPVGGGEAT